MNWKFWTRKEPAEAPPATPARRSDGWENQLTGIGQVGRDKSLSTVFAADELSVEEAEQLWQFDDLAAKTVEKIPAEMFREGFEFSVPGDKGKDLAEAVTAASEDLDVEGVFQQAVAIERALGGAAIFPVINDGASDLSEPLREDKVSEVRKLVLFDPRELQADTFYNDFSESGRYGSPKTYWLQPDTPGNAAPRAIIHESRLIIFPGISVTRRADARRQHRGWGISVLTRCHRVLRQYNVAWDSAGALLHDFSQAIIKVKGLAEMLSIQGEDRVRKRLLNLDLQRSVIRAMILDSEEDFSRTPTPMTGLAELLDRFATRYSAAADVPVSVLFGDAPAGLNATGQADRSSFQDTVKSQQRKHLLPRLNRMFKLLLLSKSGPTKGREPENWAIKFKPLEQMTEQETADLRNKQADTDTKYTGAGILSPAEVAVSRFGGDSYSLETVIDVEGRGEPKAPDPEAEAKMAAEAAAAAAPQPDPNAPKPAAPKKEARGDGDGPFDRGDADQPHVPAGSPKGGQFASKGGGGAASAKRLREIAEEAHYVKMSWPAKEAAAKLEALDAERSVLMKGEPWVAAAKVTETGAKAPAPTAPPVVPAAPSFTATSRPAGGSQGGKWYKDEAGQEWFGKHYDGDAERLGAEHASNRIYREFDVLAPKTKIVDVGGKRVLMSREIKGKVEPTAAQAQADKKFMDGFVVDAWLANRDVVGATRDNLLRTEGGAIARIDNGSSFHLRAMGGGGKPFGREVSELDSMRNQQYPAGKVFGKLGDADLRAQLQKFAYTYAAKRANVARIIDESGMPPHVAAKVKATLDERAAYLGERLAKMPAAKADAAPTYVDDETVAIMDYLAWGGEAREEFGDE